MFNTCSTRSNPALEQPTGDLEHILYEQQLSFHTKYNHEGPRHVSDDNLKLIHALNRAFQSRDCKSTALSPKSRAQSAIAAGNPETESDPRMNKYILRIVAQEISRAYSRRSLQVLKEAVENALSYLFFTGTAEVDCRLKTRPTSLKNLYVQI